MKRIAANERTLVIIPFYKILFARTIFWKFVKFYVGDQSYLGGENALQFLVQPQILSTSCKENWP